MEKLKVKGNNVVDSNGKEILLKGTAIIDPAKLILKENHNPSEDLMEIKKIGFNTVRVVIVPSYWQANQQYNELFLDPLVAACKQTGLYCLLDWHAHGNPIKDETRNPEQTDDSFMRYDARKEVAERALLSLAQRYGKEEHVLFELFCNPLGPSWGEWKALAQSWINEMRKHTKNVIVVSGVTWFSDLSGVLADPVSAENVVYGVGLYPGHMGNRETISSVKEKYPVIITECGFSEEASYEAFRGTRESYGIPFKQFIDKNKLSWISWVYHPIGLTSKASVLINSWKPGDLSEWGRFVKEELLK